MLHVVAQHIPGSAITVIPSFGATTNSTHVRTHPPPGSVPMLPRCGSLDPPVPCSKRRSAKNRIERRDQSFFNRIDRRSERDKLPTEAVPALRIK